MRTRIARGLRSIRPSGQADIAARRAANLAVAARDKAGRGDAGDIGAGASRDAVGDVEGLGAAVRVADEAEGAPVPAVDVAHDLPVAVHSRHARDDEGDE